MSQWKGLDHRLNNLGFMVGVPSLVYERQLSREWFLIVEGERIKDFRNIDTPSIKLSL